MAPFMPNYQVIRTNFTTDGLTFKMSERRSYAFRDPAIAPRDHFLGDMGDEVAREFITLNPVLPREAFTIKNLIDYVARALQANMVHWGQKPVRVSRAPLKNLQNQYLVHLVVVHYRSRQRAPRIAGWWSRCQGCSVLSLSGTQ